MGDRCGCRLEADEEIVSVIQTSKVSSNRPLGMLSVRNVDQASSSSPFKAGESSTAIWPLDIRYSSSGSCIFPSGEHGKIATLCPASRHENVRIEANLPEPSIRTVFLAASADVDASCGGGVKASRSDAPLSGFGHGEGGRLVDAMARIATR